MFFNRLDTKYTGLLFFVWFSFTQRVGTGHDSGFYMDSGNEVARRSHGLDHYLRFLGDIHIRWVEVSHSETENSSATSH